MQIISTAEINFRGESGQELRHMLNKAFHRQQHIVLNLAAIGRLSGDLLHVLMSAEMKARTLGSRLTVRVSPEAFRSMSRMGWNRNFIRLEESKPAVPHRSSLRPVVHVIPNMARCAA